MNFDYKKILKAYIEHVDDCESIDYIEGHGRELVERHHLTIDEYRELLRLSFDGSGSTPPEVDERGDELR